MAICYQFTFYRQFTPFLGTATLPQYPEFYCRMHSYLINCRILSWVKLQDFRSKTHVWLELVELHRQEVDGSGSFICVFLGPPREQLHQVVSVRLQLICCERARARISQVVPRFGVGSSQGPRSFYWCLATFLCIHQTSDQSIGLSKRVSDGRQTLSIRW